MGEEGWASEVVEKCLYVKCTHPRHEFVRLHPLGFWIEMQKGRERRVSVQPASEQETKAAEDLVVVSPQVRQTKVTRGLWQRLRPEHKASATTEDGVEQTDTLRPVIRP